MALCLASALEEYRPMAVTATAEIASSKEIPHPQVTRAGFSTGMNRSKAGSIKSDGRCDFLKTPSSTVLEAWSLGFNVCGTLNVCQFVLCTWRALRPYDRSLVKVGHRS